MDFGAGEVNLKWKATWRICVARFVSSMSGYFGGAILVFSRVDRNVRWKRERGIGWKIFIVFVFYFG